MELKQELLHRKYEKGNAVNQVIIGEDCSIPDGKPDVAKILGKKSEVVIKEVHGEKGKVRIHGALKLWILYLTERAEKSVDFLEAEIPFDEILYMEEAANGDHLKIEWEIEELKVGIIHPGKLSIRVVVTLRGTIVAEEQQRVTAGMEVQEKVFEKTRQQTAADPVILQKETYRVKEEIVLKNNLPNVHRILWKELQLQGVELQPMDGRLGIKGELLFFAAYEAESDETKIIWLDQILPFQGALEIPQMTAEMFGICKAEISGQTLEVHPDNDGEMRVFSAEILMDIPLHLYEQRNLQYLTDAYGIDRKLMLEKEKIVCEKLRCHGTDKYHFSGQVPLTEEAKSQRILCHHTMLRTTRSTAAEGGILWEGMLQTEVLYEAAGLEHPYACAVCSIPCSRLIEIPKLEKEDHWELEVRIEKILPELLDGEHLQVRGSLRIQFCVMERHSFENIIRITEEDYDAEEYRNRPGLQIHFIQPGETLWDLAKKNRCSVQSLMERNELECEETKSGQKLLIVKEPPEK